MSKKYLAIWLCLAGLALNAQPKKISVEVAEEIVWAGVDRPGDLFILLRSGEVQKYNLEGKILAKYKFTSRPDIFEPGDGVQSFYYIREGNRYGTLTPDLIPISEKIIEPAFAVAPWLACSIFHDIWILDGSDLSLKKTKWNATAIAYETPLIKTSKNKEDLLFIRDYQNYIFLLDKKVGVHMYTTLGRYMRTLGEKGMEYFNFYGEEFYYTKGDEMILTDLYNEETRKIKLPQRCNIALITENTLYAIEKKGFSVYAFKPD